MSDKTALRNQTAMSAETATSDISTASDKETFLSRWSQRKAEQQTLADHQEQEPEASAHSTQELAPDREEDPVLTDADMPDIKSLDEASDFSQFLSTGVSDDLRNLALRKLFCLPEFNVRDGLNDYDDDFSKMPELAEAVASQLRNWVNQQKDDFEAQLKDDAVATEDTSSTEKNAGAAEPDKDEAKEEIAIADDLGTAEEEG